MRLKPTLQWVMALYASVYSTVDRDGRLHASCDVAMTLSKRDVTCHPRLQVAYVQSPMHDAAVQLLRYTTQHAAHFRLHTAHAHCGHIPADNFRPFNQLWPVRPCQLSAYFLNSADKPYTNTSNVAFCTPIISRSMFTHKRPRKITRVIVVRVFVTIMKWPYSLRYVKPSAYVNWNKINVSKLLYGNSRAIRDQCYQRWYSRL